MNIKGLKIAVIGDSQTQFGLGQELVPMLQAAGAKVTNLGVGGTSADQWVKKVVCFPGNGPNGCKVSDPGMHGASALKQYDLDAEVAKAGGFDLVIVSLGSNDGANASAAKRPGGVDADKFVPKLLSIMKRVAPLAFYIGPGAKRGNVKHYEDANIQPYYAAVAKVMGGAAIHSYPVVKPFIDDPKQGDGVHFFKGSAAAKAWARAVLDAVMTREPYRVGGGGASKLLPTLTVAAGALIIYLWWRGRQATVLTPQPALAGVRRR
jgi:lysophospholipase L1-like esterase